MYIFFFISLAIVFFNLRFEYAYVFHKSSLTICLKYAYLGTFKRANFMIRPTPEGSELVKGLKMEKMLKFVSYRLLK